MVLAQPMRRVAMPDPFTDSRRRFLKQTAAVWGLSSTGLSGILTARAAPAAVMGERLLVEQCLQIGDVLADRAIVWSRTDRPARMLVEWDLSDRFLDAKQVPATH